MSRELLPPLEDVKSLYGAPRDYYYRVMGDKRFCIRCGKEITDWLNVHECKQIDELGKKRDV